MTHKFQINSVWPDCYLSYFAHWSYKVAFSEMFSFESLNGSDVSKILLFQEIPSAHGIIEDQVENNCCAVNKTISPTLDNETENTRRTP